MKKAGTLLAVAAAALLIAANHNRFRSGPEQAPAAPPTQETLPKLRAQGVEVVWQTPLEDRGELAIASPRSSPVQEPELRRAVSSLYQELARYPRELVARHLDKVYLYREFWLDDAAYAGSWGTGELILAADGVTLAEHDRFFRTTVHHEFSSLLVHYEDFPLQPWRALLPEGFAYLAEQRDGFAKIQRTVAEGLTDERAPAALDAGFVHQYGTTSLENDVNAYAELLFMEPGYLRALATEHPRVAAKCRLLTGFYRGLGVSVEGCGG